MGGRKIFFFAIAIKQYCFCNSYKELFEHLGESILEWENVCFIKERSMWKDSYGLEGLTQLY